MIIFFLIIKFNQKIFGNGFDRSYYITSYVSNMKSIDYQFRKIVLEPLINILNQHKEELNNRIDKIAKQNKQSRYEILKNLGKERIEKRFARI